MPNIFSRRDLSFQLYEVLKAEQLCQSSMYQSHSKDIFEQMIDVVEKLAEDKFQPHAAEVDRNEPTMINGRVNIIPAVKEALDAFADSGLPAASFAEEYGGMQLPYVISQAMAFIFGAANVSTSAYALLSAGAANLLCAYGSKKQQDLFLKPLLEGRYFGTMCLSETQAGSSLADIKTKATPQDDGSYQIVGNKMWISGGEHEMCENIVHLVLAKTSGGAGGVKDISLFIVPKYWVNDDGSLGQRNDVNLAGINHKMGFRGTVNAVLHFGEKAGAKGYLVGEPGKGLSYMFHMMNEARIGVGLGATSLAYTGYLHALEYAKERRQGKAVEEKDPTSAMVPIIEHADVKRMLLQQKAYAEGGLALGLYCAQLIDQQRIAQDEDNTATLAQVNALLDILTPIAKSWPSEYGLRANDQAIQVHGGYGYSREYPVERFYRDNRLNPIHEGTKGIQGLDLLGRKITQNQGASAKALYAAITRTFEQVTAQSLVQYRDQLSQAIEQLFNATQAMQQQVPHKGVSAYLANATVYLDVLGHMVVAWMWLKQAITAQQQLDQCDAEHEQAFYQGKLQTCHYFYTYELPSVLPKLALLSTTDTTCLEFQEQWF